MLRELAKRASVRLLTWITAWLCRMVWPAYWPGLPCMVFVSFNSSVVRLLGCTVKHDAPGNLSLTLTWNAPEGLPIAVTGEDSVYPPDTVSFVTALMSSWTDSGELNNAPGGAQAFRAADGSKLVCAWCTPRRAGVIVTANSLEHNTSV
jgi:hypothetical protein